MEKVSKIVIGAIAVVALFIAVTAKVSSPKLVTGAEGSRGPRGEQGIAGPQGEQGIPGTPGRNGKDAAPTLGGVSTLNLVNDPVVSINGVKEFYVGVPLTPGTSTPCTIKSPGIVSSLKYVALRVSTPLVTGSSAAITWTFGTSTVPNATTTPYFIQASTESASPIFEVLATSTLPTQTLTNIAANTWLNWSLTGTTTTTGTTVIRGTCQAVFTQI